MMSDIFLKTRIKEVGRKWSKKVRLYGLLLKIFSFARGTKLKFENESHKQQRKKALNFKVDQGKVSGFNIVFIVVDAFRFDYLGLAGSKKKLTSFIDSLEKESIVGLKHYTPSSWTWPSVNSILTGLYPRHHGGFIQDDLKAFNRLNFPNLISLGTPSLVDFLEKLDYRCRLFSGVVTADLAVKGIFNRGFFDPVQGTDLPFPILAKRLKSFVRTNKKNNFFIYFQPGDLHMPIQVPKEYLSSRKDSARASNKWEKLDYWGAYPGMKLEEYKDKRIKFYEAALAYTDDQIKDLVDFFKKEDLYEKTIFVLTADHGEELWDHLELEEKILERGKSHFLGQDHGHTVFEELVRIPLFIFGGPIKNPKEFKELTSHIDLVPSVLDLLNIRTNVVFDGLSLLSSLPGDRAIFLGDTGYGYEQKAVIHKDQKLIQSKGYDFEIFQDLSKSVELDLFKLGEKSSQEIDHLRKLLKEFEEGKEKSGEKTEADDQIKKRLEKLGYL